MSKIDSIFWFYFYQSHNALVEIPRLIYLVFLSLHILIFKGKSLLFNGLYLWQPH